MLNLPYMGGYPQRVIGESSTQPTTFGVIGMFKGDQRFQGLQQVVERPSHYKLPPLRPGQEGHHNTDRNLLGAPAKTHYPGIHYGMVPFAGRFASEHGHVEVYHGHHPHHDQYHKEKHGMDHHHPEHKREHHEKK